MKRKTKRKPSSLTRGERLEHAHALAEAKALKIEDDANSAHPHRPQDDVREDSVLDLWLRQRLELAERVALARISDIAEPLVRTAEGYAQFRDRVNGVLFEAEGLKTQDTRSRQRTSKLDRALLAADLLEHLDGLRHLAIDEHAWLVHVALTIGARMQAIEVPEPLSAKQERMIAFWSEEMEKLPVGLKRNQRCAEMTLKRLERVFGKDKAGTVQTIERDMRSLRPDLMALKARHRARAD